MQIHPTTQVSSRINAHTNVYLTIEHALIQVYLYAQRECEIVGPDAESTEKHNCATNKHIAKGAPTDLSEQATGKLNPPRIITTLPSTCRLTLKRHNAAIADIVVGGA